MHTMSISFLRNYFNGFNLFYFNAESMLISFLMLSESFGGILQNENAFYIFFVVKFKVVCKNIIFNAEYEY